MATAAVVKPLTQAEVDKYVRRDSRLKLLVKVHEEKKKEFKQALLNKEKCPDKGPFVLEIQEQQRSGVDWKNETLLLLQEAYGIDEGQVKLMELEANTPKKTVEQLAIKRNLKYQAGR